MKMKKFFFKGFNQRGDREEGIIEAYNIRLAKTKLFDKKINVKKIHREYTFPLHHLFKKTISSKVLCVFSRQLAELISSGIHLLDAIRMIAHNINNKRLKTLLTETEQKIREGESFSFALQSSDIKINPLFYQLIHIGEETGKLDIILKKQADYQEKILSIRAACKKALIYPCTVILIALAITCFLLIFVIPQFAELFKSFGAALPLPTHIVLMLSHGVIHYGWIVIPALCFMTLLYKTLYRLSEKMRLYSETIFLKCPFFGSLKQHAAFARFCYTLSLIYSSGIPLLDGFSYLSQTKNHPSFHAAIMQISYDIRSGNAFNQALKNSDFFPKILVQMVAIGEETGKLSEMLDKLTQLYETKIEQSIDKLNQLLEPAVMLIIGVIVGGLMISMYLPIFKLGMVI